MAAGFGMASSGELFATYRPRIRRYILSMVHDPDEADDLTQDVFLQAHRRLSSLRDPNAVVSWLYRIATRLCYDRFRQWSRRPRSQRLGQTARSTARTCPSHDADTSLNRVLEQAEMSACVRGYLDQLPDDYRNVILLHDLDGLTSGEIAEMLGASRDAVKIRLHRARRKLEAALTAHCRFSRDEEGVFVCESRARSAPGPAAVALPRSSEVYLSRSPRRLVGQEIEQGDVRGGGDGHDAAE